MQDVAQKHQQILKKLSQYQNGEVSETMDRLGLGYQVNYGLSIPQINDIAKGFEKDNGLALFLWQQPERESKLIALRLAETENFSKEQSATILKGVSNIELAEQAAIQLFVKLSDAMEHAMDLIESEGILQFMGYVLFSRIALSTEKDNVEFLEPIKKLMENLPKSDENYLKRGFAQAFLRLGLRSPILKKSILDSISVVETINKSLADYLEQEVVYYLDLPK